LCVLAGVIPQADGAGDEEKALRDIAIASASAMIEAVENMKIDQGLSRIAGVLREVSRYLEKKQPWNLAKKGDIIQLGTVLYYSAESLRIVSGLLYPVMPAKMTELRKALGLSGDEPDYDSLGEWGKLEQGTNVGKSMSLFPRIKQEPEVRSHNSEGGKQKPGRKEEMEGVMMIEYTDFEKVELRTAKIIEAEKVEGADRLLQLQVEIGEEKRQIVAGIAQHYKPEDLVGKTVVVVANLKPAKIRGVESNGMLLAASSDDDLRLISVDGDIPSGAKVK
ncbi:methionine--tRNA ligase subunit beta, partial [Verrucomicrobiota bacterium]